MTPRPGPNVPTGPAKILADHSELLNSTLDGFFDWTEAHKWVPTDDSPLADERRSIRKQYGPGGDWDDTHSKNVSGIASTLLGFSTQYLEAIRTLLDAHQVIMPLPPLVRSTFEASCRIAWLLAPLGPDDAPKLCSSPARPRVARATLIQLEDLTRLKTAALGLKDPKASKYAGAVHLLRKKKIPGLFDPSEIVLHPNGSYTLCGQSLPGLRAGALEFEKSWSQAWRAGGTYDFLSNASHPTPHIAMFLTKASDTGLSRFEIDDITYITRLVRLALVSFLQAWQLTAEYLGLPVDPVWAAMDGIDALDD